MRAQESTIGAAFLTKTLPEHGVKFEIWCAARAWQEKAASGGAAPWLGVCHVRRAHAGLPSASMQAALADALCWSRRDTAGQERYHSLAPMYYRCAAPPTQLVAVTIKARATPRRRAGGGHRGAAAAVVVYDITNADSFAKAKSWVKELLRQGNPAMIMALAGNKADLTELRAVQMDEAKARTPHAHQRT